MDPLGQALFGLQADDNDFDDMALITDIPMNSDLTPASTMMDIHPAATMSPSSRSNVSSLAQQWEKENEMAKQMGRPQRAVCTIHDTLFAFAKKKKKQLAYPEILSLPKQHHKWCGFGSFHACRMPCHECDHPVMHVQKASGTGMRVTVSAPTLRGDTEMEVDRNRENAPHTTAQRPSSACTIHTLFCIRVTLRRIMIPELFFCCLHHKWIMAQDGHACYLSIGNIPRSQASGLAKKQASTHLITCPAAP